MARTRLTARKSTGGQAPRHQLAPRSSRHKSKFLGEFGMPTLLWRVLSSMGYPKGRETGYYWNKEQRDRVTTAHRNYERMLVHVLGQRNEAWHEEDTLRARQLELEQQLANAEEYNENLHEEIHQLHNQLHPHHLPGAAELDSEDEMDEDLELEAAASGDEYEEGYDMDSDHSE